MIGTECGLLATYERSFGSTVLKVALVMTDREYVAKFAEICNLSPPNRTRHRPLGTAHVWRRDLKGLRALMVLKEVLPYLLGNKLKQAIRAIEFFSPTGYRRGFFTSDDVWPPSEFPNRKGPKPRNIRPSKK